MSHTAFARALQSLEAPYLLDDAGTQGPLGTDFAAVTHDGVSVRIVRLAGAIADEMRDVEAFVRVLETRAHRTRFAPGAVLGAGTTAEGEIFFVTARPAGESLATRLARASTVPPDEVRELLLRAATLLGDETAAAGPHGLITPGTVMVFEGGISFSWGGLLAALRAGGAGVATIVRQLGCEHYLAPEVQRGAPLTAASDIFGLGTTMYEALTGRAPFGGRTTSTVMALVLADDVVSPSSRSNSQPRAAILRAIEREPADRWHDAAQLLEALQPAGPAGGAAGAPGVGNRHRRPNRAKVLAVLAALVIGALVLWALGR